MNGERVVGFELSGSDVALVGEHPDLDAAAAATPDGAYSTFRTWAGRTRLLRLGEHLRRLEESSRRLGRESVRLRDSEVAAALAAALAAAPGTGEVRVRLTLAAPRLFAALEPFSPPAPALRRDGVACATVPQRREDPARKDTRFAAVARRALAGLPPGAHEGLMLGADGAVLEGLSSNFFAISAGRLRTEATRVLPGLTRALVLELARRRLPVELRPIRLDELAQAEECFITSSSRGILPVVRVDGQLVGDGRPGPITRELMRALDARIESETESLAELVARV